MGNNLSKMNVTVIFALNNHGLELNIHTNSILFKKDILIGLLFGGMLTNVLIMFFFSPRRNVKYKTNHNYTIETWARLTYTPISMWVNSGMNMSITCIHVHNMLWIKLFPVGSIYVITTLFYLFLFSHFFLHPCCHSLMTFYCWRMVTGEEPATDIRRYEDLVTKQ